MKPTKVFLENLKAYKDGFRTIVNKGSARSGKTVGIIQVYDFIATESSKHRKLSIASQSYPHLKDGALYEYDKHQMRESVRRSHNKSAHEFYIKQSIINYFGCDNPAKSIGPGRDICYINECNKGITHEIYNNLLTRTTECMFLDYNPSGEFWLHTEKILEEDRTKLIHSTWLDNIDNLSKNQIADFIRYKKLSKTSDYWSYYWKVYGLGEDAVLLEERIMPMIKQVSKLPDDCVEIPSGLDFGWFPDPTAFARMWVKRTGGLKDQLYIKEIIYNRKVNVNSKSSSGNLTDLLMAKGINPKHQIIAECAQPGAVQEMRDANFNIESVKKISVEASIRLFHDYDIFIVGDSPNAYREMNSYKYKRNKRGVILGIPEEGQDDHIIDLVRYVLMSRNLRWSIKTEPVPEKKKAA